MSDPGLPLSELYLHGRQFHPNVPCDRHRFEGLVRSCLERGAGLADVHARAAELYLVCACLANEAAGYEVLEEEYVKLLDRTIARIDPSPAFVSGVKQQVRSALLGESGRAYLAEFIGRAPLGAWIRVFALKLALQRSSTSMVSRGLLADDPALAKLWPGERARVQKAVREAVDLLDVRARTVLRLHEVDHLRIDDIARIYRVHHAVAMSWLDEAKRAVRNHVIASLGTDETPAVRWNIRKSSTAIWQLALSSTIVAQ